MLELNPDNIDALKNIFLKDNAVVTIENISCVHRDAIGKDLLEYLGKFDVNGYTMSYRFKPILYIRIDVNIDELRKTVLLSEQKNFEAYNISELISSECLIKYNSTNGIPVW